MFISSNFKQFKWAKWTACSNVNKATQKWNKETNDVESWSSEQWQINTQSGGDKNIGCAQLSSLFGH